MRVMLPQIKAIVVCNITKQCECCTCIVNHLELAAFGTCPSLSLAAHAQGELSVCYSTHCSTTAIKSFLIGGFAKCSLS